MALKDSLKVGLKEAFEDCQDIQGKGCTDSTNDKVAGIIAKPIAEAIEQGVVAGNVEIFFQNDEIVFKTKEV